MEAVARVLLLGRKFQDRNNLTNHRSDLIFKFIKRQIVAEETYWHDVMMNFGRLTIITMALPVIVAILYKKYWNKALYAAFLFCLATLGVNLFEQALIWSINTYTDFFLPYLEYWEISNTFFLNILYYLKNLLLLGWFYSLVFPVKPFNSIILYASYILATAAIISYFIEGYQNMGVVNPAIDTVFIILLPLIYLWVSRKSSLRIPLKKNPYFWISLGLLVPNSLGLFLFFSGDYIHAKNYILYCQLFSVKNVFEIIGQVFISLGFIYAYHARFIKAAE